MSLPEFSRLFEKRFRRPLVPEDLIVLEEVVEMVVVERGAHGDEGGASGPPARAGNAAGDGVVIEGADDEELGAVGGEAPLPDGAHVVEVPSSGAADGVGNGDEEDVGIHGDNGMGNGGVNDVVDDGEVAEGGGMVVGVEGDNSVAAPVSYSSMNDVFVQLRAIETVSSSRQRRNRNKASVR